MRILNYALIIISVVGISAVYATPLHITEYSSEQILSVIVLSTAFLAGYIGEVVRKSMEKLKDSINKQ